MTVDPHNGSRKPTIPASWNRYTYVLGDPINHKDPTGLDSLGCFENCSDDPGGGDGCWIVGFDENGDPEYDCGDPGQPQLQQPPPPDNPPPDCTIEVFNRPIESTHHLNIPGAQHGYIVFIDANGNAYIFEGEKDGKQLKAVDTSSDQGPALPKDNPGADHLDGSITGPEVCDWLSILQQDASNVNGTNIRYHWYGPNSSSVLRYMLQSLPDQSRYNMPWMIGYGALLPGIETP